MQQLMRLLFGDYYHKGIIYGYKYDHYKCSNCNWHFLLKESPEEEKLNEETRYSSINALNDISFRDVFKWEKNEIVKNLCQACGERPAVMKFPEHLEYAYKCEACGKYLCKNCMRIGKGAISREHYYCPTCASSRMCSVCGKNVAEYTCSSCGRRICKDCAHGILSKKCPNCK